MMPTLHSPGVMIPGQFGPIRRTGLFASHIYQGIIFINKLFNRERDAQDFRIAKIEHNPGSSPQFSYPILSMPTEMSNKKPAGKYSRASWQSEKISVIPVRS